MGKAKSKEELRAWMEIWDQDLDLLADELEELEEIRKAEEFSKTLHLKSEEELEAIYSDPSHHVNVGHRILEMPNCPPSALRAALFGDDSYRIRIAIYNPRVTLHDLYDLVSEMSESELRVRIMEVIYIKEGRKLLS